MAPVIPAGEHPAAPEGETGVSGLTEAEKEPLRNTIRDMIGRPYGFDAICRQVERIVAERVRVVEGERDAARAEHNESCATTDQWRDQKARAESAEAKARADERERIAQAIEAENQSFGVSDDPYGGEYDRGVHQGLLDAASIARGDNQ